MAQVVVMGVAGCGKSTVGRLLAASLGVPFADGDDLHPPENIAKMASGTPLSDEDRWPWLADVGRFLAERPIGAVVASSALKRSYRDAIRALAPGAFFLHLRAEPGVLQRRLARRQQDEGHFMGAEMLASQIADLEPLGVGESGLVVDVGESSPSEAAQAAITALGGA